MKTLLFVAIFFSGAFIFSMNSTEGRQELAELSLKNPETVNINVTLDLLKQEASQGIIASALAHEMYLDFMSGSFPRHIGNSDACRKLVSVGLGKIHNGDIRFVEYFVSDELPSLQRAARFNKKGR